MDSFYELSKAAEKDWYNIVEYTLVRFGKRQVKKYTKGLINCLDELMNEKGIYKEIDISGFKVTIKHCQKHYIFGLIRNGEPLLIIAIFHEKMDLIIRLKTRLS